MARAKRIEPAVQKLIQNLRENEGWMFQRIGESLGYRKDVVFNVYKRLLHPKVPKKVGRPRKTCRSEQPAHYRIGKDESYYEDIMSKINGVLWPGGAASFSRSHGYADAATTIYRIAKRYKTQGDHFPILAICLGFEFMTYVEAGRVNHRVPCRSENQPLPLKFRKDFRNSRLFKEAPSDVIEVLRRENVTANYHANCVTREGLAKVKLDKKFRVMSINHDWDGIEFISSLEHVNYPFYGLQFHPERKLYDWKVGKKIPHSKDATIVAQYFANFFVNEARNNMHRFPSSDMEAAALIYNYRLKYTALDNLIYTQCYMFHALDTL